MKNFKFLSLFKIWATLAIVVIVAGIALGGILGYNFSYDLTGGCEVNVSVISTEESVLESVKGDTEKVLKEKGLVASEISKAEKLGETEFIFRIQKTVTDGELVDIQSAVESKLSSLTTVTVATYHSKVAANFARAWWVLLAAGITLAVAFIYLAIRYKWAVAFSAVCAACIDVLLIAGVAGLSRLPVTASFLAVAYASMLVTLLLATLFANALKGEIRNIANEEKSKKELAFLATGDNFFGNVAICGILTIIGLALVIAGTAALRIIGLQIIVGIICPVYVTLTLLGWIWACFADIGNKALNK